MRLSDAIATGRVLLEPVEGKVLSGNKGCALGMAGRAAGIKLHDYASELYMENYNVLMQYWPFLASRILSEQPCTCRNGPSRMLDRVIHLFDDHVCRTGDWTLDRLIDYVRSVEPAEQEEPQQEALAEQATVGRGL